MIRLYNAKILTPSGLLGGELRASGRYICYLRQEGAAASLPDRENTFERDVNCGGGILLPLPAGDGGDPCAAVRHYLSGLAASNYAMPFKDGVSMFRKADLILIDLKSLKPNADSSIFQSGLWVIAETFRKYQRDLLQSILVKLKPSHIRLILTDGHPLSIAG